MNLASDVAGTRTTQLLPRGSTERPLAAERLEGCFWFALRSLTNSIICYISIISIVGSLINCQHKYSNTVIIIIMATSCNNSNCMPTWHKPCPPEVKHSVGLSMMNSLTRKKEPFVTMDGGKVVKWYMCGPTVYAP